MEGNPGKKQAVENESEAVSSPSIALQSESEATACPSSTMENGSVVGSFGAMKNESRKVASSCEAVSKTCDYTGKIYVSTGKNVTLNGKTHENGYKSQTASNISPKSTQFKNKISECLVSLGSVESNNVAIGDASDSEMRVIRRNLALLYSLAWKADSRIKDDLANIMNLFVSKFHHFRNIQREMESSNLKIQTDLKDSQESSSTQSNIECNRGTSVSSSETSSNCCSIETKCPNEQSETFQINVKSKCIDYGGLNDSSRVISEISDNTEEIRKLFCVRPKRKVDNKCLAEFERSLNSFSGDTQVEDEISESSKSQSVRSENVAIDVESNVSKMSILQHNLVLLYNLMKEADTQEKTNVANIISLFFDIFRTYNNVLSRTEDNDLVWKQTEINLTNSQQSSSIQNDSDHGNKSSVSSLKSSMTDNIEDKYAAKQSETITKNLLKSQDRSKIKRKRTGFEIESIQARPTESRIILNESEQATELESGACLSNCINESYNTCGIKDSAVKNVKRNSCKNEYLAQHKISSNSSQSKITEIENLMSDVSESQNVEFQNKITDERGKRKLSLIQQNFDLLYSASKKSTLEVQGEVLKAMISFSDMLSAYGNFYNNAENPDLENRQSKINLCDSQESLDAQRAAEHDSSASSSLSSVTCDNGAHLGKMSEANKSFSKPNSSNAAFSNSSKLKTTKSGKNISIHKKNLAASYDFPKFLDENTSLESESIEDFANKFSTEDVKPPTILSEKTLPELLSEETSVDFEFQSLKEKNTGLKNIVNELESCIDKVKKATFSDMTEREERYLREKIDDLCVLTKEVEAGMKNNCHTYKPEDFTDSAKKTNVALKKSGIFSTPRAILSEEISVDLQSEIDKSLKNSNLVPNNKSCPGSIPDPSEVKKGAQVQKEFCCENKENILTTKNTNIVQQKHGYNSTSDTSSKPYSTEKDKSKNNSSNIEEKVSEDYCTVF